MKTSYLSCVNGGRDKHPPIIAKTDKTLVEESIEMGGEKEPVIWIKSFAV